MVDISDYVAENIGILGNYAVSIKQNHWRTK
jgi:hypothetical protein